MVSFARSNIQENATDASAYMMQLNILLVDLNWGKIVGRDFMQFILVIHLCIINCFLASSVFCAQSDFLILMFGMNPVSYSYPVELTLSESLNQVNQKGNGPFSSLPPPQHFQKVTHLCYNCLFKEANTIFRNILNIQL